MVWNLKVGCAEVLVSSVSLALLSSTVKIAFEKFGESVEEQIFMQHLCGIFIVFPSQWDKVGPRIVDWYQRPDWWLILNLLLSVASTFAARAAAARMAGRSPSLPMPQKAQQKSDSCAITFSTDALRLPVSMQSDEVQTIECFSQLLLVALIRAPPFPPAGFWLGTLVLLIGTLQYLRASADRHADELAVVVLWEAMERVVLHWLCCSHTQMEFKSRRCCPKQLHRSFVQSTIALFTTHENFKEFE
eukprot:s3229_g7.t1